MKSRRTIAIRSAACGLALAAAGGAQATEGYFLGGYGATQTSLSGAGVANSTDAMSLSLNPAGLVDVGRQFSIGLSFFAPSRGYDATGMGFVAPGNQTSSNPLFLIPNMAYSNPIDATSAWGVALYGNGGNNTLYKNAVNPIPPAFCPGGGVFCGGKAGVSLNQAFIEAGYAKSFGNFSIGVAPVLAVQLFSAEGLGAFSGLSSDPTALTNNGTDTSVGAGLHAGLEWRATNTFRIGLAGATPTYMSNLTNYQGLFADQGSFDIPANITAGVAWDVAPMFTAMADYKHIFYSDVPSVGDSTTVALPFGSNGGPGFGWHDVDAIALGAEWRATPTLTLRAGYEYNTNPIKSTDVTLNILAPGVTTSQFSGGLSYRVSTNSSIDLAGYCAHRLFTTFAAMKLVARCRHE